MTKKDYILIAGRINNVVTAYRQKDDIRATAGAVEVAISLTFALGAENPSFNSARFLTACGIKH